MLKKIKNQHLKHKLKLLKKKKKFKYWSQKVDQLGKKKKFLHVNFYKYVRNLVINIFDLIIYYFLQNTFKFIKFIKIKTIDQLLFKIKFIDTLRYFFFLKKKLSLFIFTKNKNNKFLEFCFYYRFMKLLYAKVKNVKIKAINFFKIFFIKKKREIFFFYNFFFFFNTEKILYLFTFVNLRNWIVMYKQNKLGLKKNVLKQYFFNFFFQTINIYINNNNLNFFKNFYYLNKNLKLKLNKSFLFFKLYIFKFFNFLKPVLKFSNKFFLTKILNIKQNKYKKQKKRLDQISQYFLFFKSTLNNIFIYVYDLHLKRTFALTYIFYKKYFYLSLGKIGYFGPSKNGDSAVYDLGREFYFYCINNKIKLLNLILLNKPNKKYKEFIKGFLFTRLNPFFKINYIYIMPQFAHNGCRRKKRRRV